MRLAHLAALLAIASLLSTASARAQDYNRERPTVPFEVSKISPLPPYTKAKFSEIWKGFREQYGVRDGIFVKYDWADSWLSEGGQKPEPHKATFEVISGLDANGRPISPEIQVRMVSISESKSHNLDQDVRGRRGSPQTLRTRTLKMIVADPSQTKAPKFSCAYEGDEEEEEVKGGGSGESYTRTKSVLYEVGTLPDNPVNQARFVDALKAGSEFRVVLPKEIACQACGGIGRPSGARSMLAKCRECEGSGKIQTIEVFLVKW